MKSRLVVVSGLPASGKSTLGAVLSDRMSTLGVGHLVRVDTGRDVDADAVTRRVLKALAEVATL